MRCNGLQTFFTFEWKPRFPETRTRSVFGFLINTATLTVQRCMTFNESVCRQAKKSSNLTKNPFMYLTETLIWTKMMRNDEKTIWIKNSVCEKTLSETDHLFKGPKPKGTRRLTLHIIIVTPNSNTLSDWKKTWHSPRRDKTHKLPRETTTELSTRTWSGPQGSQLAHIIILWISERFLWTFFTKMSSKDLLIEVKNLWPHPIYLCLTTPTSFQLLFLRSTKMQNLFYINLCTNSLYAVGVETAKMYCATWRQPSNFLQFVPFFWVGRYNKALNDWPCGKQWVSLVIKCFL